MNDYRDQKSFGSFWLFVDQLRNEMRKKEKKRKEKKRKEKKRKEKKTLHHTKPKTNQQIVLYPILL
jgi:hypothetical protein